jgi:hypothetical protein|tara:strand:- start:328 stop:633 length:306 start_codon:yes stop_codon:yes gene_type:complete
MSAITNFSINLEAIPKDLIVKGKKGSYINLTMFQNDETKYGNNASISLSQSQEDREAKNPKVYLGNGKVVWVSDDNVSTAEREREAGDSTKGGNESNDLPF